MSRKSRTPTAYEHYVRGEEILAACESGQNVRPDAAAIATAHFIAAQAIIVKQAAELDNGLVSDSARW